MLSNVKQKDISWANGDLNCILTRRPTCLVYLLLIIRQPSFLVVNYIWNNHPIVRSNVYIQTRTFCPWKGYLAYCSSLQVKPDLTLNAYWVYSVTKNPAISSEWTTGKKKDSYFAQVFNPVLDINITRMHLLIWVHNLTWGHVICAHDPRCTYFSNMQRKKGNGKRQLQVYLQEQSVRALSFDGGGGSGGAPVLIFVLDIE